MSDKELIKQEIEKQIDYAEDDTRYTESYREGLIAAYQTIKTFIDSLPEENHFEGKSEMVSEDLKEEIERWIKKKHFIFTEVDEIIETARHFAKWKKQKSIQDFLEKAEMYLKTRVYYNMHPNNITTVIQEFKNYIQDAEI